METPETIKLIYILSSGRSGSTILDMLLGNHIQCWSLGELQILPWEYRKEIQPCGCGLSLRECPFWGGIFQQIKSGELNIQGLDRFRERPGAGKVLRISELGRLIFGLKKENRKELKCYVSVNEEIFRVLRDRIGDFSDENKSRWLVDASKDPYRLAWLLRSSLLQVKVIHLTKHPCGFAHSMLKNISEHRFLKVFRMGVRYNIENLLLPFLLKRQGAEIYHLRYEDLASSPQETMTNLFDWLGLVNEVVDKEHFREDQHGISGNKTRYSGSSISLDEAWREKLAIHHTFLTKVLTFFSAWQLGYFSNDDLRRG